ncbi:MAG: hypothetical protein HC890_14680 [Chloroflexaceae bacterium]|nr:hypothetical protein [Chloroflexaceae bacterium]
MRLATIYTPQGPRAAAQVGTDFVDLHATDSGLPASLKHLIGGSSLILQAAQEAAQRAESQQSSARTLSDWLGAESAWQEALAQVRAIPAQTSGYQRKKQILADYLAKLVVVRQHQQREEQALNFYHQSAQRAAQAKTLQAKQQWSAALAQWRSAIAALEQVPETSGLHAAAQSRLISYQQALEQLDFQEQAAQRRQQAAGDLEKTCSGPPRICQYQIGNPIRVTLTAAYEQQVEQTALSAQQESDRQISAELLAHLESLESSFATIASNAGAAIQVYDAQGRAIVTYSP